MTGLEKSGYKPAQDLALNIVKKWVKNGFIAYKDTIEETGNAIYFEKYDVEKVFLILKLVVRHIKKNKRGLLVLILMLIYLLIAARKTRRWR